MPYQSETVNRRLEMRHFGPRQQVWYPGRGHRHHWRKLYFDLGWLL